MVTSTAYGPANGGSLSRTHWAGDLQDIDIHIEAVTGLVDGRFQQLAIFQGYTTEHTVSPDTQTLRIDRMRSGTVQGRRAGEALVAQRTVNDKMIIVVDTTLYTRNPIDYQDDWTSPDRRSQIAKDNGSAFAEMYDNAHIIQAIKARNWVAPTHLKPAFKDGIEVTAVIKANPTTQAEFEANAVIIHNVHKACVEELITRRVPLNDMSTFLHTSLYSQLIEHPKLMNLDWGGTNADGFKQRRVTIMNGLPIIEFLDFPTQADVDRVENHPLGAAFNVTADDLKCKMVTLSKSLSLITAKVKDLTTRFWDSEADFSMILDMYTMYTVGVRRPDSIAVGSFTEN